MKFIFLTIIVLLALQADANCQQTKYDRLPPNVMLETEVRKDVLNRRGKVVSSEITTVEKRLKELKARYRKNVLVDGKGREIRFFEPLCRGVSAGFEEDQKAQKEKVRELAALKKSYTVIVLYCNPLKAV